MNPIPNPVLDTWNDAGHEDAVPALLHCCSARRWAEAVAASRPYVGEDQLYSAADRAWETMEELDWMEAFRAHPRIGERQTTHATAQSSAWSQQEQSSAAEAQQQTLEQLAQGNALYEQRFGFTYIVRATGKSAEEMLAILQRRLNNDRSTELREAAEQQRQIMQIRLRKWLQP